MTEREVTSGASGRVGLATFRDVDWEDFVGAVDYLPTLALSEGTDAAIGWAKTELRSLLALFSQATPPTVSARMARSTVALFFTEGVLRLLAEPTWAGSRARTAFVEVVYREYFEPSAKAVFDRSTEHEGGYAPSIPGRGT